MVVPQSNPPHSGETITASDRDFALQPSSFSRSNSSRSSSSQSGTLDSDTALSSLKNWIAAGDHGLDSILETIASTAQFLTDASGSALAMWKDGGMMCRARSGEDAPPLGARLNAETGISWECLRTGKMQHCTDSEEDPRVDREACRSRGLRSIAVLPIRAASETNGILLAFSTEPAAFTERHIALLEQLASMAERARAAEPQGTLGDAPQLPPQSESAGVLPAPDRLSDVALAFVGRRSRPFVLGAIGVIAIGLVALAIWLGWRGPNNETEGKAHAARPVSDATAAVRAQTANAQTGEASGKPSPDKASPDKLSPDKGEAPLPSSGKSSAGTSVKLASQLDMVVGGGGDAKIGEIKTGETKITVSERVPVKRIVVKEGSRSDAATTAEPPPLADGSNGKSDVGELLSAKGSLPVLPVSQGVSGGRLLQSVQPTYPAQARQARLEGKVVLAAMVMEDGSVGDIRVVKGSPVLARSAVDAVKNWRYEPYQLDGKPVKNETTITIDFRFPGSTTP